nr:hypothetical protein [Kocuria rhizophila]
MSTPTNGSGPEGQPENQQPHDGYTQQGQYQGQPYGQQGYPQQGYYQEPPKKKRKKWPWIVGAIVLLLILMFAGCAALVGGAAKSVDEAMQSTAPLESTDDQAATSGGESAPAETGAAATKDQLTISTSATEAGSVSYGSGGSMSTADFTTKWDKTVTAKRMDFFSVTVQDKSGAPDAKVTCTMTRDGKKTEEQSATGAYAVATCTDSY